VKKGWEGEGTKGWVITVERNYPENEKRIKRVKKNLTLDRTIRILSGADRRRPGGARMGVRKRIWGGWEGGNKFKTYATKKRQKRSNFAGRSLIQGERGAARGPTKY